MKKIFIVMLLGLIMLPASAKKANAKWYFLTQTSSSITEDENIKVEYGFYTRYVVEEYSLAPYPVLRASIYNKTDKIIFVDLGTSYLKRNDMASAIYTPQSTSTMVGQNIGIGVNAGAIANAVGIGGKVGTVMGGVNVGGGKSSSTTTTIYNQRFVSVPPKSSVSLDDVEIFIPNTERILGNFFYFKSVGHPKRVWCLAYKTKLKSGEIMDFSSSPFFNIGIYLNYSLSENFESSKGLETTYAVTKLVGTSFSTFPLLADKEFNIVDKTYPNWRDDVNEGKVELIRLWAH